MGQQPHVHAGFLKSWLAGDLKDRVIARVLMQLQQHKGSAVKRVLVTGECSLTREHGCFEQH